MFKVITMFFFLIINFRFIDCKDQNPKVSIITSLYNGDIFIEKFMKNITSQSIFKDCELIIINANSPGSEEKVIKKFLVKFANIKYIKLEQKVTIYEAWNLGINQAKSDFITNANLDDQRLPDSLNKQLKFLEKNPSIDLVYGDCLVSFVPNQDIIFHINKLKNGFVRWPVELSTEHPTKASIWYQPSNYLKSMRSNPPGPMPMWRKSIHRRLGYFNSSFISGGDWDMWLRAVQAGCKFAKINSIIGLYHYNPSGLSTQLNTDIAKRRNVELELISKYFNHIIE